jgi:hypothetical protein
MRQTAMAVDRIPSRPIMPEQNKEKETNMKQRGKTNRRKASLKRKSVRKNLRKSAGDRKYA